VEVAEARTVRPLDRWSALGGILYVALFVIGAIVSSSGQPDTDSPPAKLIAYYSDSDHRDKIAVGWLLVVIGVFFFFWFLGALRQVVRRLDGDGVLGWVTTAGGAVYAACTLAAFSINVAGKTMSSDTYRDQVYPEVISLADAVVYVLHSAGGAAVGAMMVATSIAALRARALPAWVGWLSVLAGLVAVVSIFFIPWFVIAVWLVVASLILVWRRPAPSA
jgi:hypothetical protein